MQRITLTKVDQGYELPDGQAKRMIGPGLDKYCARLTDDRLNDDLEYERTFGNRLEVSVGNVNDLCAVFHGFSLFSNYGEYLKTFGRLLAVSLENELWIEGRVTLEENHSPVRCQTPNPLLHISTFVKLFFALKLSKSVRLIVNLQWDWV